MTLLQRRRSLAGALGAAVLLGASLVAVTAGPASSAAGFELARLGGADRYGTAATIATASFASSDNVVLASGAPRSFPDALTGNYLAGIGQGPVLLTAPDRLPAVTRAALGALRATRVFIVGGPAAVSPAVEADLRGSGYAVERLGGADRYATAELVVKRVSSVPTNLGTTAEGRTAVLGSGQDFPDILAGGPLSWSQRFPLAITRPDGLPADTRDLLVDLQIRHVVIVGGPVAVSAAVEAQVRALVGTVTRLAGGDRAETAARIADYAWNSLGYDPTHVDLARSDDFADALAAGPHAGRDRAPILLTSPTALSAPTQALLEARSTTLAGGHVFGGAVAVSDPVVAAAVSAGTGTAPEPPSPSPSPTPTAPPPTVPASSPPATTPPTTPATTAPPVTSPTVVPTVEPTVVPTVDPTVVPTVEPTVVPTVDPTVVPTVDPTVVPTVDPTVVPTVDPTVVPTVDPTVVPTVDPTVLPIPEPTGEPVVPPGDGLGGVLPAVTFHDSRIP